MHRAQCLDNEMIKRSFIYKNINRGVVDVIVAAADVVVAEPTATQLSSVGSSMPFS